MGLWGPGVAITCLLLKEGQVEARIECCCFAKNSHTVEMAGIGMTCIPVGSCPAQAEHSSCVCDVAAIYVATMVPFVL